MITFLKSKWFETIYHSEVEINDGSDIAMITSVIHMVFINTI